MLRRNLACVFVLVLFAWLSSKGNQRESKKVVNNKNHPSWYSHDSKWSEVEQYWNFRERLISSCRKKVKSTLSKSDYLHMQWIKDDAWIKERKTGNYKIMVSWGINHYQGRKFTHASYFNAKCSGGDAGLVNLIKVAKTKDGGIYKI